MVLIPSSWCTPAWSFALHLSCKLAVVSRTRIRLGFNAFDLTVSVVGSFSIRLTLLVSPSMKLAAIDDKLVGGCKVVISSSLHFVLLY